MHEPDDENNPGGYDRDRVALLAKMEKKNEQLGYESWLPPLKDCTAVFVFEDENGEIQGGFAYKRIEEFIVIGDRASVLHAGFQYEGRIREVLARRGATELIGAVPLQLLEKSNAIDLIMKRLKLTAMPNFMFFEGPVVPDSERSPRVTG